MLAHLGQRVLQAAGLQAGQRRVRRPVGGLGRLRARHRVQQALVEGADSRLWAMKGSAASMASC